MCDNDDDEAQFVLQAFNLYKSSIRLKRWVHMEGGFFEHTHCIDI